jgi:hypothetical protein
VCCAVCCGMCCAVCCAVCCGMCCAVFCKCRIVQLQGFYCVESLDEVASQEKYPLLVLGHQFVGRIPPP